MKRTYIVTIEDNDVDVVEDEIKKIETDLLEIEEKAKREDYLKSQITNFINILPAFVYGLVFVLESFVNANAILELGLAMLSFSTTFTFEYREWKLYNNRKKGNIIKETESFYLVLLIVFVMFFVFVFNGINHFVIISPDVIGKLPNIVSSVALLGYYLSYGIRIMCYRKLELNQYSNAIQ